MAMFLTYKDKTFGIGDTIRVHFNVKDGDKTRIQIFEGILMGIANRGEGKAFTVRKIAAGGVGVEKITPVNSPVLANIELVTQGDVRRAKLTYLRGRTGKGATRIKKKTVTKDEVVAPVAA